MPPIVLGNLTLVDGTVVLKYADGFTFIQVGGGAVAVNNVAAQQLMQYLAAQLPITP